MLSEFIEDAHRNIFATFANKKPRYRRLSELDACFDKIASNLSNSGKLIAAVLLPRSHSAYRGACRLALSGQTAESYPVLRTCLEYSLYALHINKNPILAEIFLRRHDSDASLRAVRNEFRHAKLMSTLRFIDVKLYEKINHLYQRTIDFGAHPNELAITSNTKITNEVGKECLQIYLHGDGLALENALKTIADCGLGGLLVFRLVFAERFALLGISEKIDEFLRRMWCGAAHSQGDDRDRAPLPRSAPSRSAIPGPSFSSPRRGARPGPRR